MGVGVGVGVGDWAVGRRDGLVLAWEYPRAGGSPELPYVQRRGLGSAQALHACSERVDGTSRTCYSYPPVGRPPKADRLPKETFQRSNPSGTVLRSTRHQHRQ
jgi:hypothetical protein